MKITLRVDQKKIKSPVLYFFLSLENWISLIHSIKLFQDTNNHLLSNSIDMSYCYYISYFTYYFFLFFEPDRFFFSPISLSYNQVSSREMIVSYLDEDLLILRDTFGSPEILRRKSMEFKSTSEPYFNVVGSILMRSLLPTDNSN